MSTFKVHYAGLGKNRATNRHSNSTQESDKTNSIQTPNLVSNESPTGSFFKNAKSQNDLFAGFHSENLDYINLLISKTPKQKKEVQKKPKISRDQKEKKEISKNPALQPESPFTSRKPVEVIAPVPKSVEIEKPPSVMEPDNDDGILLKVISCQKQPSEISKNDQSENQFYEGFDTQISPELTPTLKKQEDVARRVYKDDAANRRSMSLEDIRFDRKDFGGNHNRSTSHYPEKKVENRVIEQMDMTDRSPNVSAQQGSRQSLTSPKGNFLASLDNYIDYFKKSGDISYRSMKAGQYLNGSNTGKSYRSLQRELDAAYREIEIMKAELDKRKRKIGDLVNGTKMLQKQLQVTTAREEEQQQLLHKMQGQIEHLTKKNTTYKLKNQQLKELFRQERMQNESSLLSLKQVLSKNIKVALEHKSNPYLGTPKDRHSQLGSMFPESTRNLKRDHEKVSKQSNKHADSEIYSSLYAPDSLRKLRKPVNVSKQKMSVLVSDKASCSSPAEELIEEEEYVNPVSSRFENSYEGEDQFQEPYGQNLAKDCQIQFLKHKLAELTNNEDLSFNALTPCGKSTDKATNRSRQSLHKKKTSAVILPSYYISKHADNQPYLPVNYRPQDQTSRARNYGPKECFSPNYGSERSFSLHSNE